MRRCGLWFRILALLILSACGPSQDDPFGAPPKEISPNCGPEFRYKFKVNIRSAREFVAFLEQHQVELTDNRGNNWVRLDNYKQVEPGMSAAEMEQAAVDWDKVLGAVVLEKVGRREIYRLDYEPYICPGQEFTLKMTEDGHVSLYGCCGK